VALSSLRQRQPDALPEADALQDPLEAAPDPELDYLRVRYAEEFRAAFQVALNELSSHQRLLLRLHLIDGLSLMRIAGAYHVSQSTISRRLEQAREMMGARMKIELQTQLGVTDAEFESLVRLAQSRFEFSLSHALQSELSPSPSES
jgi:RNA polymerase sigma-70 factor (ECF subfamily)